MVEVLTDFPERFSPGARVLLDDVEPPRAARLVSARWHQGRLLLTLEGTTDREAAEALRGVGLLVPEKDVAPRPPGFVYHFDVEGCVALSPDGRTLGTVTGLEQVAGRYLLIVETPQGRREVPFVDAIVVQVDTAARRVVIDAPEGLLE